MAVASSPPKPFVGSATPPHDPSCSFPSKLASCEAWGAPVCAAASLPNPSRSSSSSAGSVVCEHCLEGLLGHVAHRLVRGIAALRVGSTRVRHARANGAAALRHRAAEPRLVPSLAQPLDASQRLELDVRRSVLDAGREVLGGVLDLLPGQGLEHTRELIEQVGCDREPGEPRRASGVRSRQWFDQRFDPE